VTRPRAAAVAAASAGSSIRTPLSSHPPSRASASMRFIEGEPMKPATKTFAGRA
jgi:hypothetical protein